MQEENGTPSHFCDCHHQSRAPGVMKTGFRFGPKLDLGVPRKIAEEEAVDYLVKAAIVAKPAENTETVSKAAARAPADSIEPLTKGSVMSPFLHCQLRLVQNQRLLCPDVLIESGS